MSVSSEKLQILANTAERLAKLDPGLLQRIETFELTWEETRHSEAFLPCVKITFKDTPPSRGGGIGIG